MLQTDQKEEILQIRAEVNIEKGQTIGRPSVKPEAGPDKGTGAAERVDVDAGGADGGDLWKLFAGGLRVLSERGSRNNLSWFSSCTWRAPYQVLLHGQKLKSSKQLSKAETSFCIQTPSFSPTKGRLSGSSSLSPSLSNFCSLLDCFHCTNTHYFSYNIQNNNKALAAWLSG